MNNIIKCPHCQKDISLDDALTHQITADFQIKLEKEKTAWELEQKKALWAKAQKAAGEKINEELKLLKEENERRTKELDEARQMELKLRQDKNRLDEEKKNFELDKQRQLDTEREKIRKETADGLLERHRLLDAEKDKKMSDMMRTIEQLQQKGNQGSQQLQGEVLELELESELIRLFPLDVIEPVGKGINGADIIQKVRDNSGRQCGIIVWELKRTKTWDRSWPAKLKEDLQRVKGDVAVLVTITLPEGIKYFGHRDGIYVSTFETFDGLAMLLRRTLIDQQIIKTSVVGKNEKMEMVYNYFLSNEFRQRVETIAEAFSAMKMDLENEKKIFAKMWAKREKEIERVVTNTVSMHGELQGLIGTSMPTVDSLEPESLLQGFEKN